MRQTGRNYEDLSNDEHEEEGARTQLGEQIGSEAEAGAVYGQNLGLHVSEDHLVIFSLIKLQFVFINCNFFVTGERVFRCAIVHRVLSN